MPDLVLNQLYPGGVMKQLADAVGGITYDQYEPGGCAGQLYRASGLTVPYDQYAPGGPAGQVEAKLEDGGASGAPDWVPVNAVIHIDLVGGSPQGRAWVAGTGEVAVDTLLGSDANANNFSGTPEYDPANLMSEGYKGLAVKSVAFIGAARTAIIGNTTFVIRYSSVTGSQSDPPVFIIGTSDGGEAIEMDLQHSDLAVNAYSYSGDASISIPDIVNSNPASAGIKNTVAVTLAGSRFEVCVNGSTAATTVIADADRPAAAPFVAGITVAEMPIQSITLYDPLPSTAGLSELSEVT